MKIGIVGYGHVGTAMKELFKPAVVFDSLKNIGRKEDINECDVAFICVPTPMAKDGSCDTTIVEEVISWCKAKVIVLRSTVRIGFTREMREKYNKEIVFQPEYYGETVAHPFANLSDRNWLIFGGTLEGINMAIRAYQLVVNSNIRIYQCSSDEAEMVKYMENAFLATKVIFCNEMFDLCKSMNLNWNIIREMWIADPRTGSSHTFIFEDNRGFGGSCLPKDISSLRRQGLDNNVDMTLLSAVIKKNNKYH